MANTINLIPQEERIEQQKTKVVKLSTILALVLLVIVGSIGGYFFYRTFAIKQEMNMLEASINGYRSQISELTEIEINARSLYTKSTTLQSIFDTSPTYSILLDSLDRATPSEITVDSFGLSEENTITVSGRASTYNAVQDFSNRLLSQDMFTRVELNSVGLESRTEQVSFFIIVSFNGDLL